MSGLEPLHLAILPDALAICRLDPATPLPDWAQTGAFHSVTRTATELSIVCREDAAPPEVTASRGWQAITVEGALDFALTGILASLAEPLATAGVSIFAVSTYDTDCVLVKAATLARAVAALTAAGHRFAGPTP